MTFQSLTLKVIPETRHAHLVRYLHLITKQQIFTIQSTIESNVICEREHRTKISNMLHRVRNGTTN